MQSLWDEAQWLGSHSVVMAAGVYGKMWEGWGGDTHSLVIIWMCALHMWFMVTSKCIYVTEGARNLSKCHAPPMYRKETSQHAVVCVNFRLLSRV